MAGRAARHGGRPVPGHLSLNSVRWIGFSHARAFHVMAHVSHKSAWSRWVQTRPYSCVEVSSILLGLSHSCVFLCLRAGPDESGMRWRKHAPTPAFALHGPAIVGPCVRPLPHRGSCGLCFGSILVIATGRLRGDRAVGLMLTTCVPRFVGNDEPRCKIVQLVDRE